LIICKFCKDLYNILHYIILIDWGFHMKKGLQYVCVFILLFSFLLPIHPIQGALQNSLSFSTNPISPITGRPPSGQRWDINQLTIVYLNGSFYNMGYQLGELLVQEIQINQRAFNSFYEREGITMNEVMELWDIQKQYVPQELIDYIQGTADALGLDFEDIACTWVAEGAEYCRCSSFTAWGDATKDGELVFARSLEFPLSIEDPLTGDFVQDYPILVIANPDEYNAFMYPTFAGYVMEDGLNEKGVAISNMWSANNDKTKEGSPMGVRLFEALYKASTAQQAIKILTDHKTFGYNFIVADASVPIGYAVETTGSLSYSGTWDNPVENKWPFWAIENVVRRTNCFLHPNLAATQRDHYSPRHPAYCLGLIQGTNAWWFVWNHFKALSKGIESNWGRLDVNSTLFTMRSVYHGMYDPLWNFMLKTGMTWTTWWQWVACPKSGEVKISFAKGDVSAHQNTVFEFNFLNTLENHYPS